VKITKRQLRRIIREELIRERQFGMDPDPGGQEVRDAVDDMIDDMGGREGDVGWDAIVAGGPTGLANWLVSKPQSMHYHLLDGGIWIGMAKQFDWNPEEVGAEICKRKPDAWKDWDCTDGVAFGKLH
jgi:hypothetical protein